MELLHLNPEEERFADRMDDLFQLCRQKNIPRFSTFLDERQQKIAQMVSLRYPQSVHCFFGGYEGAQRQMLGVFPDYMEPSQEAFPLVGVTATYRQADSPTHRDFLGALMALMIKREAIGDLVLIPQEGKAVLFLSQPVAPLVLEELRKVGKVGIQLQEGIPENLTRQESFQLVSGTVLSPRLDAVLSVVLPLSREKATQLIRQGKVSVNHEETLTPTRHLQEGDLLSVRGFGRFQLDAFGAVSKKGRLHITCKKFV